MNYIELNFRSETEAEKEMLSGILSQWDVEGIEETQTGIKAYFKESALNRDDLRSYLSHINPEWTFEVKKVPDKNWNEEWEKNYNPIYIDDKVLVRAPFHQSDPTVIHDIIIEPKMAFGTGHHATTRTMIERMLQVDLKGKKVLDLGSGSGILSVVASKLMAETVVAIDYDEWAFNNSEENKQINHCPNIMNIQGDLTDPDFQDQLLKRYHLSAPENRFDIILANLNKNLLMEIIPKFSIFAKKDAHVFISGILEKDYKTIEKKFFNFGYTPYACTLEEAWIVAEFI